MIYNEIDKKFKINDTKDFAHILIQQHWCTESNKQSHELASASKLREMKGDSKGERRLGAAIPEFQLRQFESIGP